MSSRMRPKEQIRQLNLSYTEYQNRLRRREHGGMALKRLEADVAEILGRSRYEFYEFKEKP